MEKEKMKGICYALCNLCLKVAQEEGSVVVTGHDMPDCDSIISAVMLRELLSRLGVNSCVKFGTRPDGVTERLVSELGALDGVSFEGYGENDKLVLVDHHATFYHNEVLACIDHHLTPPEPNFGLNVVQKASSCGRIIFDLACSVGVCDDWMEKMAIFSVYFDTQSTLAPKFEKSDLPWLDEAIPRLGLDKNELTKKGFCLNSPDEDAKILMMYAYKKYELDGKISASGCLQIDHAQSAWEGRIEEVISLIVKKLVAEKMFGWALVINKPLINQSDIYFIHPNMAIELVKLDRLASRSRDVIPKMKEL